MHRSLFARSSWVCLPLMLAMTSIGLVSLSACMSMKSDKQRPAASRIDPSNREDAISAATPAIDEAAARSRGSNTPLLPGEKEALEAEMRARRMNVYGVTPQPEVVGQTPQLLWSGEGKEAQPALLGDTPLIGDAFKDVDGDGLPLRFFMSRDAGKFDQSTGGFTAPADKLLQLRSPNGMTGDSAATPAAGEAEAPNDEKVPVLSQIPMENKYFSNRLTAKVDGNLDRSTLLQMQAATAISLRKLVEFPGTLPGFAEEVWVIQKYCPPDDGSKKPAPGDDYPGSGTLMTKDMEGWGPIEIPIPLKHTGVRATITGNIASVNVSQQFTNPFASKIEAVYVFPLPENAAVNEFVMTVGDRHIRGIIRDRAEARQIYDAARAAGHVASLLEQERPNIFTQSVANIEPGKDIGIDITYFNTLSYIDGSFEFAFPMVVGPRFNPAGFYDGVGAVSREAAARRPGSSGQPVEVPFLKPTERSGHDISITVDINAGVPIERVWSDSHVIDTSSSRPAAEPVESNIPEALRCMSMAHAFPVQTALREGRQRVTLSPRDNIPNKDFVLRYKVAGNQTRSGIITYTDKNGDSYFSALIIPPADAASVKRSPVELVFVLDCSGSMNGRPIEQAVAAVKRGLKRLEKDDTFQIINFAGSASQLGAAPILATDDNIKKGLDYVGNLFAEGGTYMIPGLRASLDFPHDPRRLRFVCFLTDGFIGNEAEIIGEIQARLGPSRIFSMGIGSSVNRYLIDAMAKVGRGCVAHVAAGDAPEQIMDRFFDRISRPAMTDLALDLGGLQAAEVFPRVLPDLFVGRAVVIIGRLRPGSSFGNTVMRIHGKQQGADANIEIPIIAGGFVPPITNSALAQIWARHKIADLADTANPAAAAESVGLIKDTALRYSLMSAFTSFVAVDSLSQTAGNFGTTVQVPVPMPEGVKYETNVQAER